MLRLNILFRVDVQGGSDTSIRAGRKPFSTNDLRFLVWVLEYGMGIYFMKITKISKNIDPKELELGIKVEKEHLDIYNEIKALLDKNDIEMLWTVDEFAEKIAKAHFEEMKDYYTRLVEMEAKKD